MKKKNKLFMRINMFMLLVTIITVPITASATTINQEEIIVNQVQKMEIIHGILGRMLCHQMT